MAEKRRAVSSRALESLRRAKTSCFAVMPMAALPEIVEPGTVTRRLAVGRATLWADRTLAVHGHGRR